MIEHGYVMLDELWWSRALECTLLDTLLTGLGSCQLGGLFCHRAGGRSPSRHSEHAICNYENILLWYLGR